MSLWMTMPGRTAQAAAVMMRKEGRRRTQQQQSMASQGNLEQTKQAGAGSQRFRNEDDKSMVKQQWQALWLGRQTRAYLAKRREVVGQAGETSP